ncbi:hypothetical protein Tco_0054391 [Tanacetum coccineum]
MQMVTNTLSMCGEEYDEILEDDFATASRGEEIDLTFFPLAPGPYVIPYLFEGDSSPLYTKQKWDGPYLPENNILCKDIFRDPDVCRKALDRTVTLAELRMTESLLPLELSNCFNVLSTIMVSHGMELNTRYTNLVASKALTQEKLEHKLGYVKDLRSEVTTLDKKLERTQRDYGAQLTNANASSAELTDELVRTDAKLSDQALVVRNLQLFDQSLLRPVVLSKDRIFVSLSLHIVGLTQD